MTNGDATRIVVTASDPARSHDPELSRRKVALYADAIRRHGGDPVVVDPTTAADARDAALASMNGLLITGGADLDPALYGEPVAGSVDIDADRDALDRAAWDAAEKLGVPVLGICRGFQAINVFSGGSLLQDVPDHAGTPYGSGDAVVHNMEIRGESRLGEAVAQGDPEGLASIDGDDTSIELEVNTYHHQAVNQTRLAPTLRAVGWAASMQGRLVEAVESKSDRWLVGIQCHPERTESTPHELEGLFEAFVRAAREASERPVG